MHLPLSFVATMLVAQVATAEAVHPQQGQPEPADEPRPAMNLAAEFESLAFINAGYAVSGVFGYDHYRARLLTLNFDSPDLLVPEGFSHQNTTVYGVIFDYYFSENLEGVWTDIGFEYGTAKLRESGTGIEGEYSSLQIGTGLGYLWEFWSGFYVNPWVGVNMNIIYDDEVVVGGTTLKQNLLVPLAGAKVGWRYAF